MAGPGKGDQTLAQAQMPSKDFAAYLAAEDDAAAETVLDKIHDPQPWRLRTGVGIAIASSASLGAVVWAALASIPLMPEAIVSLSITAGATLLGHVLTVVFSARGQRLEATKLRWMESRNHARHLQALEAGKASPRARHRVALIQTLAVAHGVTVRAKIAEESSAGSDRFQEALLGLFVDKERLRELALELLSCSVEIGADEPARGLSAWADCEVLGNRSRTDSRGLNEAYAHLAETYKEEHGPLNDAYMAASRRYNSMVNQPPSGKNDPAAEDT